VATASRDYSSINVRILTRSPLAKRDFDLFKTLGHRLLFGMSLPTLRNDLARLYEPKAPAPSQRLATLKAATEAGIPIYVAMAPTPAEVDENDVRATLTEIKKLNPLTVFHEPINIRAENILRIQEHAKKLSVPMNTDVFATRDAWKDYSISQLKLVERVATELGLGERLHLWPDPELGSKKSLLREAHPKEFQEWLNRYWHRISEWPAGGGLV